MDHHRTGPGGRGDQLRRRGIAQSGRRWERRGGGHVHGGGRDGEETQTREPIGRGGREPPRGGERVEGDAANLDSFVPVVPPTRVRRRRAGSVQTGHTRSRRAGDGASGGLGDDRGGDEVPSGGGVRGEDPLDSRREGTRANGGMTSTHTTTRGRVWRATRRRKRRTRGTDRWDEGVEREATIRATTRGTRSNARTNARVTTRRVIITAREKTFRRATRQRTAERSLSAAVSGTILPLHEGSRALFRRARVVASDVDRLGEDGRRGGRGWD